MSQVLADVSRLNANSNTQMGRIIQLEQENANLKNKISQTEANAHLICDLQCQINYGNAEIEETKNAIKDLQYITTENIKGELQGRISAIECEVSDIRSALDAQTEKSKQKSDLEIFSRIEWDEEFLKIMNEPIIVDF
jgi:uncharacterized protein YceH (UPF0502 family)